jgi:hypothetical protein
LQHSYLPLASIALDTIFIGSPKLGLI